MAGVGNFVLGNLPNLIRQQCDDGLSDRLFALLPGQ
jgi:hypothetical protein